jgi:hypothetical protein
MAAIAIAFVPMHSAMASIITFDDWTLAPYSTEATRVNNFNIAPIFVSISNALLVAFTNTVYTPGTPVQNVGPFNGDYTNDPNFYYSSTIFLNIFSPSLNIIAGHHYAISFEIDLASFVSSADYHVELPTAVLTYLSSTVINGCSGECGLALIPNSPSEFSIDFIPSASGPIEFGIQLATGANAPRDFAASSSGGPFAEGGFYLYATASRCASERWPPCVPLPRQARRRGRAVWLTCL